MKPVRCFVAAALPGPVREDLGRLQKRLARAGVRARWVRPDRMHLTVRFLGEVEPDRFAGVLDALAAPLVVPGPLRLAPDGLGAFPSPARPRVVWAGLTGDRPALARAALEVEARLEPLGFPRERRPFRAHLTLGRFRAPPPRGIGAALEAVGPYRGPGFAVTEFVCYESRLHPSGPEYIPRGTATLG